ncbi:hypothetical protein BHU72_14830 [Desulfuribacillus stibiiarsenatis]|uniref:Uncharacterized protein n=1 Tax=Desulfuribacillus stibiiarsenatis TaxID=1390249 RepID=A0A1E5L7B0_9FIRM|nr:hypothetical protein [Desulfuribacillus stibiiarsenatis]OEH86025.1 hypothetical protein BHU72_14830 [Desulfuribacillus stibiiarsenatis]
MTWGFIVQKTFTDGNGWILFALLALGFVAWVAMLVLGAFNKASIKNLVGTVSFFIALGLVLGVVIDVLNKLIKFTQ